MHTRRVFSGLSAMRYAAFLAGFVLLGVMIPATAAPSTYERNEKIRALLDNLNPPEDDGADDEEPNAPVVAPVVAPPTLRPTGVVPAPKPPAPPPTAPKSASLPKPASVPMPTVLPSRVPTPSSGTDAVDVSTPEPLDVPDEWVEREVYDQPTEYVIDAGDAVKVNVFDNPEFSGDSVVGPDGKITLPIYGQLKVAGLTATAASLEIRRKLLAVINDPKVSVAITNFASNRAVLLGKIKAPASYALRGSPTLLEFLAEGGGPQFAAGTTFSSYAHCTIFRGKDQIIEVDLNRLLKGGQLRLNIPVRRGDIVYLAEEERRFYVLGAIRNPGLYPWEDGMTLLRGFAVSGQAAGNADIKRIRILRGNLEKPQILTYDISRSMRGGYVDPPLLPNDVIFVPQKGSEKFLYLQKWLTSGMSTILLGDSVRRLFTNNGR